MRVRPSAAGDLPMSRSPGSPRAASGRSASVSHTTGGSPGRCRQHLPGSPGTVSPHDFETFVSAKAALRRAGGSIGSASVEAREPPRETLQAALPGRGKRRFGSPRHSWRNGIRNKRPASRRLQLERPHPPGCSGPEPRPRGRGDLPASSRLAEPRDPAFPAAGPPPGTTPRTRRRGVRAGRPGGPASRPSFPSARDWDPRRGRNWDPSAREGPGAVPAAEAGGGAAAPEPALAPPTCRELRLLLAPPGSRPQLLRRDGRLRTVHRARRKYSLERKPLSAI